MVRVGMSVRKFAWVAAVAAVIAAGFSGTPARTQGFAIAPVPGPQAVQNAIASFPSGGEPLKQQISDLIKANPDLASTVANMLTDPGLSPAVKEALEAGLADALNALGVSGFVGIPLGLIGVGAGVAAGGAAAGILLSDSKKTVSPN